MLTETSLPVDNSLDSEVCSSLRLWVCGEAAVWMPLKPASVHATSPLFTLIRLLAASSRKADNVGHFVPVRGFSLRRVSRHRLSQKTLRMIWLRLRGHGAEDALQQIHNGFLPTRTQSSLSLWTMASSGYLVALQSRETTTCPGPKLCRALSHVIRQKAQTYLLFKTQLTL